MFEDVTDPEKKSIRWDWLWSFPVFADEARTEIVWGCVFLFVVLGIDLLNWQKQAVGPLVVRTLALLLLVLLAITRSQVIALALAADTAVMAWMGGMPHAGESVGGILFRFGLPFLCVFWLGRRCEAYHRFRAEEKTPTAAGEQDGIHPG